MTEPTTEPLARPLVRLDFFSQTVLLTRFGEPHSQTCYPVAVMGRIRSWYKQAERKGGFNFEAERVQYLGRPSGNRAGGDAGQQQQGPGNAEHDDWMRDYDSTEQAGQGRR